MGAQAHETKLSSSRLWLEGTTARSVLELNAADLELAAGAALERYLSARVRLAYIDGPQCAQALESVRPEADHVIVELRFTCAPLGRDLAYRVTLFHELDPAARHVVTLEAPERRLGLLGVGNAELRVSGVPPGLAATLSHYLLAGIEHIVIGYDHIAFLIAVIVPGGGFWALFAAVTAFTLAHSITLSLAVLGVAVPPVRIVEMLIAGTIVYAAAENLFVRDLRRRWRLTFIFGLVHGFGFASVLREYGVPADAVAPALAAFNVGVELGQLLIIAAVVALWRVALSVLGGADAAVQRRLTQGVSAAILLLGLYWLGARSLD
jgi:hypothetical protein